MDVVDGDHEVFSPDIINKADNDEYKQEKEEEWFELTYPSSELLHPPVNAPSDRYYNENHRNEVEDTSTTVRCIRDIMYEDDYDK